MRSNIQLLLEDEQQKLQKNNLSTKCYQLNVATDTVHHVLASKSSFPKLLLIQCKCHKNSESSRT